MALGISTTSSSLLIKEIFDKYATLASPKLSHKSDNPNGTITKSSFVLMVNKLSHHIEEIKNVDIATIEAVFFLSTRGKCMTFDEFNLWWRNDRFHYFHPGTGKELVKAHKLYQKYADPETSVLSLENFKRLVTDLKLEGTELDFDMLDTDDDGVLSFKEFYRWLGWS